MLRWVLVGQRWAEGDAAYHAGLAAHVLLVHGTADDLGGGVLTSVGQREVKAGLLGFGVAQGETEEMHRVIAHSHLELLDDVGHMVMLEAPDLLNRHIEAFLRSPSPLLLPFLLSKGSGGLLRLAPRSPASPPCTARRGSIALTSGRPLPPSARKAFPDPATLLRAQPQPRERRICLCL